MPAYLEHLLAGDAHALGIWVLFTVDMAVEYLILNRMLCGLKWARRKV